MTWANKLFLMLLSFKFEDVLSNCISYINIYIYIHRERDLLLDYCIYFLLLNDYINKMIIKWYFHHKSYYMR